MTSFIRHVQDSPPGNFGFSGHMKVKSAVPVTPHSGDFLADKITHLNSWNYNPWNIVVSMGGLGSSLHPDCTLVGDQVECREGALQMILA